MKYTLINNGSLIEFKHFAETPPVLSANKGRWLPVVEDDYPILTQNQVAELVQYESDEHWFMTWVTRSKTAIELWDYPEFVVRITAPKELIFDQVGMGMKLWFDLNKLPVDLIGDNVYLYCNEILNAHKPVLISLKNIIMVEGLVNGEIVIIDVNSI